MNNILAISVCIPTFNGESYINEALDSILIQDYDDYEVIISDDSSSDNTLAIVRNHELYKKGIIQIVKNSSRGIGSNWNNCINHARGTYIKLLFQDDLLNLGCLKKMRSAITSGVAMVWSRKILIGDVPEGRQEREDNFFRATAQFSGKNLMRKPSLYEHPRNPFGEPVCSFFPKEYWINCKYDERLSQGLDYEHAYRMLDLGRFHFIDEALVSFRLHEGQTTERNKRGIIIDQFLIPQKILIHHFFKLHLKVICVLIAKGVTGRIIWVFRKWR